MDEQLRRRQIIEEARDTVDRLADVRVRPPPIEDFAAARRQAQARVDFRSEIEPERATRLTDYQVAQMVRELVPQVMIEQVRGVVEVIAEHLAAELEHAHTSNRQLSLDLRELRIEVCKLESTVSELRTAIAADKMQVTDLPGTWPRPKPAMN